MPESVPPSNASAGNRRPRRGGGGGGSGGGGGRAAQSQNNNNADGRGTNASRRGRGGGSSGGGGGGRSRKNRVANSGNNGKAGNTVTAGEPPDRGLRNAGTSGDHLARDAVRAQGEEKRAGLDGTGDTGEDDGEICFICASEVVHWSVAPCSHRTCHICSLRLRALYKSKACAHCRTESAFVIFTDDAEKSYGSYKNSDFVRTDDNLGIRFETKDIFEDAVLLLRYNCPDSQCDVACLGWPDLHRHVKSKHQKVMCDLCTRNKKVFTHEHDLFTIPQLRRHEKHGDDNPGAIEQTGFRGHPECGFCRQRFYGDDELYIHCRDRHERCYICDRRSNGRQHQYFIDYNALEQHFQQDHFLCLDPECLEKKFVVFESQMDLKAHQLEAHPAGLSKDARRDARHIDLATFDFRAPYQPARSSRRDREPRSGVGRGRDPNLEPLPVSSAQPLRRDEIAYQRQMAVQSAQSVAPRTFGGRLTAPSNPPPGPASQTIRAPATTSANSQTLRTAAPRAVSPDAFPPLETLSLDPAAAERARRVAPEHAAVMSRASALLGHDPIKEAEFRAKVSAYRTGGVDATALIDAFFSLFDTSSTELGKLVKELAQLYEDPGRRTGLLRAWADWRAINEDYPALPGPSGAMIPGSSSGSGGGSRVLRLKSSTGPSSRSAAARNAYASATNSPRLGSSSSSSLNGSLNAFPALPPSTGSSSLAAAGGTRRSATGSSPWLTANANGNTRSTKQASSSTSTTARTSPGSAATSSVSARPPAPAASASSAAAFPALPAAPKPNTLMAGLTRGAVRWDTGRPTTNAWATGTGSSGTAAVAAEEDWGEEEEEDGGGRKGKGRGKGKGKGKKGQVLYHFG